MNKFYEEINTAIKSYEEYKPWHEKTTDWICDRIAWCYKWKKISRKQTEELIDRICIIMENMK